MKTLRRLVFLVAVVAIGLWAAASLLPRHAANPALDVWMLDVGQGESVLLREPSGKKLLFDGGPDDSVLSQLGAVLPVWDRSIDLVILSHNHTDHVSGLIPVLQRYRVAEVWIDGALYPNDDYRTFQEELERQHILTRILFFDKSACSQQCPAKRGFGQLVLQVYHPLKSMAGLKLSDQHDATLSVKATYLSQSIFLTGDLNEQHEKDMLASCQPPVCSLAATVLQVPHHGSATGLLPEFLAAVHPQAALIPVGLNNKFQHPRGETLSKLGAAGIPIYRTDLQGRIHLVMDGKRIEASTQR